MTLYVLGNGFDLSHSIPSYYSSFYKYLSDNRGDVLEVMGKFYGDLDESHPLWRDFEASLASQFCYDEFSEIIADNTPNFASDDFRDGDYYDAQVYIEEEAKELLGTIRSGFESWISSLSLKDAKPEYCFERDAIFMTFNYTKTLEDIYQIPPKQILHIHGEVGGKLIFGHGESVEMLDVKKELYNWPDKSHRTYEDEEELYNTEYGHEQFAEEAVREFYRTMGKPTAKIIYENKDFFASLSDIDRVIVIGHSYGRVDFPYFKKLVETIPPDAKWILTYHTESDKTQAERIAKELLKQSLNINYIESNSLKFSLSGCDRSAVATCIRTSR